MAYTPDWEPLADALKRLTATGPSEAEAKLDLCRAVADRKIRVRVRIAKSNRGKGGSKYSDGNVGVPSHLALSDFDWQLSRPFAQWPIGPRPGEHYHWIGGWENRPIDLIELCTADVIDVLIAGAGAKQVQMVGQTARVPQPNADAEKKDGQPDERLKQRRARPAVERTTLALKGLYPNDDIPGQDSVPNKVLVYKVNEYLKSMTPPLDEVKKDTVLRAAKRRK